MKKPTPTKKKRVAKTPSASRTSHHSSPPPIRLVPIDSVEPNARNCKSHPRRSIDEIKASLTRFGQPKPIVIDVDGGICAGNGTWLAAKELGWTTILASFTALGGSEARAFGVVDNKSAEASIWVPEILAEDLLLPDIGELGFAAEELEAMAAGAVEGGELGVASKNESPTTPDAPLPAPDSPPPAMGKAIKVTAEQRAGLEEVFARFREIHQEPDATYQMSEAQILVLICADWRAGA